MINLYSNSATSSASSRNMMTGLMSGLNTEELVQAMTSGIRTRIAKQQQSKTLLNWKMDAYQNVTSKLLDFTNKYMSSTSASSFNNPNFFNSQIITAKGNNAGLVSVTGTSSTANMLSIQNIRQTAKTAGFITTKDAASAVMKTGTIDFSSTGKQNHNLAGETINISYNGTRYNVKFDKDFDKTSASDIADAFNTALAGIETKDGGTLADKIQMSTNGSEFSIAAVDPDDTKTIKIDGGSGSSLQALGLEAGMSSAAQGEPIVGSYDPANIHSYVTVAEMAGKSMTLELNGIKKDILLPEFTGNKDEFVANMQTAVDKAFGANRVQVGLSDSDELTFKTVKKVGDDIVADGTSKLALVSAENGLLGDKGILNVSGAVSNRLNTSYALSAMQFETPLQTGADGNFKLSVNGKELEFSQSQSLNSIMNTINGSDAGVKIQYLSTTNRFSVTATESGAAGRVEIQDVDGNLAASLFGTEGTGQGQYTVGAGQDAIIDISYDGGATSETLLRSSNTFDLDGLVVTLNQGAEFDTTSPITFDVQANTDEVVNNIKEMVAAYNEIVDLVNGQYSTKPDRNYAPLTEDQRKDMTESQIKTWEDKAKTGLLFGDSTMRSLASELRFVFSYAIPDVGSISDIGISTSSSYKDNGKIVIDETKLRKALEERPDDVQKIFTQEKSKAPGATANDAGIMARLNTVIDKYTSTKIGQDGKAMGVLTKLAGTKDSLTASNSTLSQQMTRIDDAIKDLQRTQKLQEDRYYSQFTSLEKYISQMNAQSSWLSQQFS